MSGTIEARCTFANWNAVPLNLAISGEYIFGFGKSVKFRDRRLTS